jgi:hypothetical protein
MAEGLYRTPEVQSDDVFSLSDIAHILNVPEARLKRCTSGSYQVVRKLLNNSGERPTGFYSLDDLYLFALVNHMRDLKLAKEAVELVVEEIFVKSDLPYARIAFHRKGDTWNLDWGFCNDMPWNEFRAEENPPATSPKIEYELDVASLVGWVNGRVQAQMKGKVHPCTR